MKTESSYYQKQFCAPIILAKNELGEYGGFTACRYKVDPQWEYVPKGYNNQSGFSVNPLFIRSPDVKTTITRGVDFYWGSVFSDLYFVQVQNSENELQNTTKIYEGETFFFVGGAGQSSGYSDRQKDTGQLMAIRV